MGIRRGEFDRALADIYRRLDAIERKVEELGDEHDTDMDRLTTGKRDRRRWTWEQIWPAAAAAAAVAGFWLAALK